jgi:hypothetical protein
MSFSLEHGRILVAILAMGTLAAILFQCGTTPRCQTRPLTIIVLVSIIGATLDVELDIFNRRGGNE